MSNEEVAQKAISDKILDNVLKTAELNTVKGRMKIIKNEIQRWKKLPLIIDVLKLNEKILELLLRKCMPSKHFEKKEVSNDKRIRKE